MDKLSVDIGSNFSSRHLASTLLCCFNSGEQAMPRVLSPPHPIPIPAPGQGDVHIFPITSRGKTHSQHYHPKGLGPRVPPAKGPPWMPPSTPLRATPPAPFVPRRGCHADEWSLSSPRPAPRKCHRDLWLWRWWGPAATASGPAGTARPRGQLWGHRACPRGGCGDCGCCQLFPRGAEGRDPNVGGNKSHFWGS